MTTGKGWHEKADQSGKAPEHVKASTKNRIKKVLRKPMKRKFTKSDAKRVGDVLGIDWNEIPLSEFHPGMNVELEHKDVTKGDEILSGKIALAHLKESKTYYTDLKEMEGGVLDKTKLFRKDVSKFLKHLRKYDPKYEYDTTITEFQRWLKEDLMPFEQVTPRDQVFQKTDYEKSIGVNSEVFTKIENFLKNWVEENIGEAKDSPIWYHGTTEDKYKKIISDGEIKVSELSTYQHRGFENDMGTISLAKFKSMAHFFSAISGMGKQNQILLHIDTRMLDPKKMKKRTLITSPEAEILYSKNIPVNAIIKTETIFTTKQN